MRKKLFNIQIRQVHHIWLFAMFTTLLTIVMSNRIAWYILSDEEFGFVGLDTAFINLVITFPICLFIGSSIYENTQLSDELLRLVNRDRLTDAATRDFFFQRLEKNPAAYGVSLMVDIDHFKAVNDTHGHFAGDAVIKHVSNILQAQVRENDIVCRFGGEEFVIFLRSATREQGENIAERMRQSIQDTPANAGAFEVSVTVSIGGSLKDSLEDINVSIKLADEALYKAKASGRNRAVLDWLETPLASLDQSRAS